MNSIRLSLVVDESVLAAPGDAPPEGGDSSNIIDYARRGIYIGFPLLQAWEITFDEPNARLRGVKPFPQMVRWLRTVT